MRLKGGSCTGSTEHLGALFAASVPHTPAPSLSRNVLKQRMMRRSSAWCCILNSFLLLSRTPLEAYSGVETLVRRVPLLQSQPFRVRFLGSPGIVRRLKVRTRSQKRRVFRMNHPTHIRNTSLRLAVYFFSRDSPSPKLLALC